MGNVIPPIKLTPPQYSLATSIIDALDRDLDSKANLITTIKQFKAFLTEFKKAKLVVVDTETNGLGFYSAEIVGYCFYLLGEAYYIPVRHTTGKKQLDPQLVASDLREVFKDPDKYYIFHNAKFDVQFLLKEGIEIFGRIDDTFPMSHLLDENSSHALKDLGQMYLDIPADNEKEVDDLRKQLARILTKAFKEAEFGLKMPKKHVNYGMVPLNILASYGCQDVILTYELFEYMYPKISMGGYADLYETERRLLLALCEMELGGVCVDSDYLQRKEKELKREMLISSNHAQAIAFDNAGLVDYNINSAPQTVALFKHLGIPEIKATKTGSMCVDMDVLKRLAPEHDIAKFILNYRAASKISSTYCVGLRKAADASGYIHARFNSLGPVTGRMSSSEPNLQNIPRGSDVRNAFVAPSGGDYFILAIDYSQIELRIGAHHAQDKKMMAIYASNGDIHAHTACVVTGKSLSQITKEERRRAKPVNFGLWYGMGWKGLVEYARMSFGVDLSSREAKTYIKKYWEAYPYVRIWQDKMSQITRMNGEVTNSFGRYRRVPEVKARNIEEWKRDSAVRQAANFIIQGDAAEVLKLAHLRVYDFLKSVGARTKIVMDIHDELIFYWHKDELDLVTPVVTIMEDFPQFSVRLKVEAKWSRKSWGECEDL